MRLSKMRWGCMTMSNKFEEGNLRFDFSNDYSLVERFDDAKKSSYGMKAVDFIAETKDRLYFIEVKDFQHPNAPPERRNKDYIMLTDEESKEHAVFNLEMGEKIKDSLLRKYAEGYAFKNEVKYLLFIHLDQLTSDDHLTLFDILFKKISGHIPTGLNDDLRFPAFTKISFDLVNTDRLKEEYDIVVETILEAAMQEADCRYGDTFRRLSQ